MKRTFVHYTLVLVAVCALAAPRAGAQDSPNKPAVSDPNAVGDAPAGDALPPPAATIYEEYRKEYQTAAQRAARVAWEFLQQTPQKNPDAQANDRKAVRDKLRPLVEESFEARQRLQRAELKELQARLAEIEQALAQREQHKEAIVDSRIDDMLNPSAQSAGAIRVDEVATQDGKEVFIPRQLSPSEYSAFQPGPVPSPPGSDALPPGTERRMRYVTVQIKDETGEIKSVVRPVVEIVNTNSPEPIGVARTPSVAPPREAAEARLGDRIDVASAEGGFDLETRERLAQLDVQAAEEDYETAEKELARTRALHERGAVTQSNLWLVEKEHRHTANELKRAKLKLEGLARRRAELKSAAEAEVAQAQAEVEREAAQVRIAEASIDAAKAQAAQLEADVAGATASLAFQRKGFDRLNQLAKVEKAVDMRLVDEKEEKLHEAQATLARAKAVVITGEANIEQAKSAVEGARAAMLVAQSRLDAAQARRKRLGSPKASPAEPKADANGPAPPKLENDAAR